LWSARNGVRSLQIMKSKFLIVADLGLVKAYKLDFEEAHSRLLDKWSRTATPERMPFPRLTSARCKRNWSVKGAATCACWPILTTSASEPRGKSSADAAAQKEAFIRELLPVIDNLERALGSDVSTSPERLGQGVQMTLQQLTTQLLRHHGIEADESLGRPFDPLYHEAVSVRHDPLNLTMSYLGPISAVIAAATKSFGRPKWSSVIQLRPKRAAETMTIRYPKCHRLGVSEYWARSCMVEHHRRDSRR
jgi:hypothetical protein